MDAARITNALHRIEAAAARIEAVAASPAASQTAHADPLLQKRYDTLRAEAEGALLQIDDLLAGLEE